MDWCQALIRGTRNLWSGYDAPDARARTGLITEAAMVDRIAAAGERYVLVSKRGRKSRTGSRRCFEDGLGLSHCHDLVGRCRLHPTRVDLAFAFSA